MKRIIILISLIGLLYSCGSGSDSNSNKDDKLFVFGENDLKTFKLADMQQIFKSFKLLDLKNNIAPLLKIKKIYFDAKQLYIVEPTGKLYVYNKATGKQQFIIDKKGQGPEEYLDIDDVILMSNEIHIYNNIKKKILKFKKNDGTFIGAKTIGIYANNGVVKHGDNVFFAHNYKEYLITKTDTNYVIQKQYLKRTPKGTESGNMAFFKSNRELFYSLPFSNSLYHFSEDNFQLYNIIRDKRNFSNSEVNKYLKSHFPYFKGNSILPCIIKHNIEVIKLAPHTAFYVKKNGITTMYKYSRNTKQFINKFLYPRITEDNNSYMYENDPFGFKEAITKNIATYKKLSQDKNCPYADFYKSLLKKLPEITEDTSPLVFMAEINE